MMELLSWNVQGAFPMFPPDEKVEAQIEYLESEVGCPDVIALNEVNRFRQELMIEGLQAIGYTDIVHTLDWATELGESDVPPHQGIEHNNGNLTAIHESFRGGNLTRIPASIRQGQWENADLNDWDTNFPEKILHATLEVDDATIDLWNVRAVPANSWGEEKIKILENTYNRIRKGCEPPCILCGDFNAPDEELEDGTIVPWRANKDGEVAERFATAELNVLEGLEAVGMVDVFRELHGYGDLSRLAVAFPLKGDDPLEVSPAEVEGKRFDHMIASGTLEPVACRYDHDGLGCSDHAPIIADFDI